MIALKASTVIAVLTSLAIRSCSLPLDVVFVGVARTVSKWSWFTVFGVFWPE